MTSPIDTIKKALSMALDAREGGTTAKQYQAALDFLARQNKILSDIYEYINGELGDNFSELLNDIKEMRISRDWYCLEYRKLAKQGWRDIKDAPRDGTHILLEGGEAYWPGAGPWFSCSAQRYIEWEPKIWQPLPPPPEEQP